MYFLIFFCTVGVSIVLAQAVENGFYSSGNGTFLASVDVYDHSPVRATLPASHVLRGLITRQAGCLNAGYAQCQGCAVHKEETVAVRRRLHLAYCINSFTPSQNQ